MKPASTPRALAGALLGAILAATGACASLARQAPASAGAIAGRWQLDGPHSDAFDARLDAWLDAHRRKLRQERRRYGDGGDTPADGSGGGGAGGMGGGRGEVPPLMMPMEDPARERNRMADDLRPPTQLAISLDGAAVQIAADDDPVRRLVPGERLARIDSGGAAELACGWEGEAFVVRSRYTHKAQRSWRYERERATGLLRVDFSDSDPEYGRLELHLRYRPAP